MNPEILRAQFDRHNIRYYTIYSPGGGVDLKSPPGENRTPAETFGLFLQDWESIPENRAYEVSLREKEKDTRGAIKNTYFKAPTQAQALSGIGNPYNGLPSADQTELNELRAKLRHYETMDAINKAQQPLLDKITKLEREREEQGSGGLEKFGNIIAGLLPLVTHPAAAARSTSPIAGPVKQVPAPTQHTANPADDDGLQRLQTAVDKLQDSIGAEAVVTSLEKLAQLPPEQLQGLLTMF